DPDRDLVWVVDLAHGTPMTSIPLENDDEPGRVVEDSAGRFHVALRKGGAVVSIDASKGTILSRTPVCAAPRGLAYDAKLDAVHVACMTGELVTLPAAGGEAIRSLRLDNDLRDVVVQGSDLVVSTFRNAGLIVVDKDGAIKSRSAAPSITTNRI